MDTLHLRWHSAQQLATVQVLLSVRLWQGWAPETRMHPAPSPSTSRHGEGDQVVPPVHAHWWHKQVSGSELHVVPDEGHISLVGRHADRILQDLLRGLPRPMAADA